MSAGEGCPIVASKKSSPLDVASEASHPAPLASRVAVVGVRPGVLPPARVGPVTDKTRALNKRLGNPTMMRLAGRRYFFAGVIRHTGRRSGRSTPPPYGRCRRTKGS